MSPEKDLPDDVRRDAFKAFIEREHLMLVPTNDIFDIIEKHPTFFTIIAVFLIIEFDLLTGEEIEFPILFTLPVALAAWGLNNYLAYGLSIALPLMRVGFVLFLWERGQATNVLAINAIITITALIGYTYLMTKISLKKRSLEEKVKMLGEKHNNR